MSETKITMTKEQLFRAMRLSEQENKKEENTSIKTNSGFKGMVSSLLHSQTQVHIFHLQTKSYSEHKALQGYYEGIDALVDGIIESYQGKYDVIKQYDSFKPEEYKSSEQVINYFKSLDDMIDKNRKSVKESYIQNQIDTVQELIYSTLYKLRFLK
jgi:high-affinity Fe2+/Pb2+ permease